MPPIQKEYACWGRHARHAPAYPIRSQVGLQRNSLRSWSVVRGLGLTDRQSVCRRSPARPVPRCAERVAGFGFATRDLSLPTPWGAITEVGFGRPSSTPDSCQSATGAITWSKFR